VAIKQKVERLEQQVGIGGLCIICEAAASIARKFSELRIKAGLTQQASSSEVISNCCYWCFRQKTTDATGYNLSERALMERVYSAYEDGRMHSSEFERDRVELDGIIRERNVSIYGEAALALDDEMAEVMSAAVGQAGEPKLKYVCRVEGCDCEYPKAA
jgi:hypothetical protein